MGVPAVDSHTDGSHKTHVAAAKGCVRGSRQIPKPANFPFPSHLISIGPQPVWREAEPGGADGIS